MNAAADLYDMYLCDPPEGATAAAWQNATAAAIEAAGGLTAALQLISSKHRAAENACGLLSMLACHSPARCQAIIAGGGIEALVGYLDSSAPDVQAAAIATLSNIAHRDNGGDAAKAAVAAAALPAAILRLSSTDDDGVARSAAFLMACLASSPEPRAAIVRAGGIPPLVRLLRRPSSAVAAAAAAALTNVTGFRGADTCTAAVEAAGGVPALLQLLATSSDAAAVEPALMTVHRATCSRCAVPA